MEMMKAEGSRRRAQRNNATYMSDKKFADLKQALKDVLAFERGERRGLTVTRIESSRPPKASPKIKRSPKR
jgi:hypothetical protein